MKIFKNLFLINILLVVLLSSSVSAADLKDFPDFFLNTPSKDIYIVVSAKASEIDTITAVQLSKALNGYKGINAGISNQLLEAEYDKSTMPNAIFIGNPAIYDSPLLMARGEFDLYYTNKAVIKVYENKGFLQIVVAGSTNTGTRKLVDKLVNWKTSGINGERYVIDDLTEENPTREEVNKQVQEIYEKSKEREKELHDRDIYIENQLKPICSRGQTGNVIVNELAQGEEVQIGPGFADSQKTVRIEKIVPNQFVDISVRGGLPPLWETDTLPKQIPLKELEEKVVNGLKIVIGQSRTEGKVMLCITETEEHKLRATCQGCFLDNKCLPIGTRMGLNYCNLDKAMESQKGKDAICDNNYECISNLCADNKCLSPNFWQKILSWFASIFG